MTTTDRATGHTLQRGRFGALDLLRGITVAAMIVVNNPGNWNSTYPQLLHSPWNGVTLTDLIFPAFIFIMGVAMSFTLAQARSRHERQPSIYRRIVMRSALLVLLGLALNAAAAWPSLAGFRIPGVLQRIGITYLFAAIIAVDASDARQFGWAIGLLLSHWALLVLPLGLAGSAHLDAGNNVAATLDRSLFGAHILTPQGDPEGALGVLSSVATALLGAIVGRWLLGHAAAATAGRQPPGRGPLLKLTVAGVLAVAVGLLWAAVLPLNKPLWTGSFAVLAAGVATLLLVLIAALTPVKLSPRSHPMLWLGTNPLAIYFLSELTSNVLQRPWLQAAGSAVAPKEWFYWSVLSPLVHDGGGRASSLVYALLYTTAWIAVAGLLQWRGVRLRV